MCRLKQQLRIYSIPLFCCASTLHFILKSISIDLLSNQLLVSLIATPQHLFSRFTWDRYGMGTTSYGTILIDDGRQSLGGKLCVIVGCSCSLSQKHQFNIPVCSHTIQSKLSALLELSWATGANITRTSSMRKQ